MHGNASMESMSDNDPSREDRLATLLAAYLDRLNAGEADLESEIRREHPDLAPDLLAELHGLELVGAAARGEPSIGTLGEYRLLRELGRGGMGVVYEAVQGLLDRRVALKVLPHGLLADSKATARFFREAQVTARLQHPNIVSIHDLGVEDRTPYFAMEYIEGETLARRLRKGRAGDLDALGCFRLAEAFAGAAEGLQHAHAKGVVHRDIKPSNLIFDHGRDQGGSGRDRLRILDFGLARLEGQESLTASGDLLGTPLYMSPEQARARAVPVDHRTDIYSLGATLYEALCGKPPFRGRDHQDTLSQIIVREPTPLRRLNPRIPRDLETIVLKCLRKEAGDRYGTAEALAQDLRRFVRGDPIEARPQGALEKLARRAARHKLRAAAAAGFLALLTAAGLLALANHRQAEREREAGYERRVLGAVTRLHAGPFRRLRGMVHNHPTMNLVTDPFLSFAFEFEPRQDAGDAALRPFEETLEELRRAAGDVPRRPDAPYHLARALLLLGRRHEAMAELDRALAASPDFVPGLALQALALERLGDTEGARRALERAARSRAAAWHEAWHAAREAGGRGLWAEAAAELDGLVALEAEGAPAYAGSTLEVIIERGRARLLAGDLDGAIEDFATARTAWPGWIDAALLLGKAYGRRGDLERAEREFERLYQRSARKEEVALGVVGELFELCEPARGLRWAERLEDESFREQARCAFLNDLGRWEEARKAGRRAVELRPEDPHSRSPLIWTCTHSGPEGWDEAESLCHEVISLAPNSSFGHLRLAEVFVKRGRFKEAHEQAGTAARNNPRDAMAHAMQGDALCDLGRLEEAEEKFNAAVSLLPGNGDVHQRRGFYYLRAGRLDEAIADFDVSLRSWPRFAWAHRGRAEALEQKGDFEGALAACRRVFESVPRNWPPYRQHVRLLVRLGRFEEAIAAGAEAVTAAPRNREIHKALAQLLLRREPRLHVAACAPLIAALEEAVAAGKSSPELLRSLALALRSNASPGNLDGMLDRALEHARHARELSGPGAVEAAALEAELLFEKGEAAEAVLALEGALEELSWGPPVPARLESYREALLPLAASYASIDAALAGAEHEDIVPAGAAWRFLRGKEEPPEGWEGLAFDDSGWESGPSGFGYGAAAATPLDDMECVYTTLYARHRFHLDRERAAARYRRLRLSVLVDDGCVAYLDGEELGRIRAGAPGTRLPAAAQAAAAAFEPLAWHDFPLELAGHDFPLELAGHDFPLELAGHDFPLELAGLREGENLLALQGLNVRATNSDFTLLPVLRGELPPDPERPRRLLDAFREAARAEGQQQAELEAYFEGRVLELEGRPREAAAAFERAAALEARRAEPVLRLAESLRAAGEPGVAEARLRAALGKGLAGERRIWELWAVICFADLRLEPGAMLEALPRLEAAENSGAGLRWLLERLAAREPLRINAGGEECAARDGELWGRDRFFSGGLRFGEKADGEARRQPAKAAEPSEASKASEQPASFGGEIAGAGEHPLALYRTERSFVERSVLPAGYRIPLPAGEYEVVLHFAELHHRKPGERLFDVLVEGERILEACEPLAAGFATARREAMRTAVRDGAIEIEFLPLAGRPQVSALEVRRLE